MAFFINRQIKKNILDKPINSIISIILILLILWFFLLLLYNQQEISNVHKLEYKVDLLTDELRDSSADLTNYARTYVVTGDTKYEKMYWNAISARNGGTQLTDVKKNSLLAEFKSLGITELEFAKLQESQDNSNKLVKTELIAMNAIKGKINPSNLALKKTNETNKDFAIRILNDEKYHKTKGKILKPIHEFNILLANRMSSNLSNYIKLQLIYLFIEISLIILLILNMNISIRKEKEIIAKKRLLQKEKENYIRQIMVSSISSIEINEAINEIVEKTGKFFDADRCMFVSYDINKGSLIFPIENYQEYINTYLKNIINKVAGYKHSYEETELYIKFVAEEKNIAVVENTEKAGLNQVTRQMIINKYKIKSYLAVPVYYKDICLGLLAIHYTQEYKHFTQDEIDLFSAIASQAALVIYQAQLFNDSQVAKNKEILLRTMINQVLFSNNLENSLNVIVFELSKIFKADRILLSMFDPKFRTFFVTSAEYRRTSETSSFKSIKDLKILDDFLYENLYEKRKILIINDLNTEDISEHLRNYLDFIGIKSAVIIPVFYQNELLSGIILTNTNNLDLDMDLLSTIAEQIAIVLRLFSLNEKLNTSLLTERLIKDIILESRKMQTKEEIINYVCDKLFKNFDADSIYSLDIIKQERLYVTYEKIKHPDKTTSISDDIFSIHEIFDFLPKNYDDVLFYNNVEVDVKNLKLREYLINKNIKALSIGLLVQKFSDHFDILGIVMICFSQPRMWTAYEIEKIKFIVDAASLVYVELKQRHEIDEIKETFLATLTHDLRSPIIAEQKVVERIISGKFGKMLENFNEYLDDIYRINEDLLRLVNNILDVYHYDSGQYELNKELTGITDVIFNCFRTIGPLARDMDSDLIANIQDSLPFINIDRVEINRVITNLLSNAIKHNKRGTKIIISAEKLDDNLKITIADDGDGIPENEQSNIFQRYPTIKRKVGSGLGLYLCKQIVEAHMGKIWFDSKIGQGTTFSFVLPFEK